VNADSLSDFIALAKGHSTALNYASAGVGTPLHLAAELFKTRAGISMTHVPYKGGGPAAVAVLAGEVQVLFGSLPTSFPHVRTGRLKALAVTGARRALVAPEIPTIAESGFPGYEVVSWYGFLLPPGTPNAIVRTLQTESAKALDLPDVKEAIMRQGLEVAVKGPQQFGDQIRRETNVWAAVIRQAGIKPE
jgi:tripartite-type tricarboxylate transporter receptor subunit TctC